MSLRALALLPAFGCQGGSTPPPPKGRPAIEVRDASGAILATVQAGRPCRANDGGIELLVGGRPLVAQHGTDRWTGEDAANGTTLKKNDQVVARIHAKQLFDENGIPVIRVLEGGDIVDKANAVVRKATPRGGSVAIGDLTISGTQDVVLAAMLTAREAVPEVRGIAACHYLL